MADPEATYYEKILTLTEIKNSLGIASTDTSRDTKFEVLRQIAIDDIEAFLRTKLVKDTYTERASGDGTTDLYLRHWPVVKVNSIKDKTGEVIDLTEATDSAQDEDYYLPDLENQGTTPYYGGILSLYEVWEEGEANYIVNYDAGWAASTTAGSWTGPSIIKASILKYISYLKDAENLVSKQIGDISYQFRTNRGELLPDNVKDALNRIMPVRVV